jgi:glycosyltransferase involved in cell wall biosynthesis
MTRTAVVTPVANDARGMPKLIVIIPALNEEGAIGAVVRKVKRVLPDTPVLVIDDHSTDRTARIAGDAGADVVRLHTHLGVGGCVRTGYQIAFERGYEQVIRIDGDGQHEARDIPRILGALASSGADVVIGSRFIPPGEWQSSFARSLGIALFRRLLAPVLGKAILDPTSGFIGINRQALAVFAHRLPHVYPEIGGLILLRRNRLRFHEVPCRMYPRRTGKSSFTFLNSFHYTTHVLAGILVNALRAEIPLKGAGRHGFESE